MNESSSVTSNHCQSAIHPAAQFLDFLAQIGCLDLSSVKRVNAACRHSQQPIKAALLDLGMIEENQLADALARFLDLERIAPSEFPSELLIDDNVAPDFLRRSGILPLSLTDEVVTLATADPLDDTSARAVAYTLQRKLILRVGLGTDIERQLAELVPDSDPSEPPAANPDVNPMAITDIERLRDVASEAPVIRLLNRIVARGMELAASDIHIEPLEDHVRVRMRVDGALRVVETLDLNVQLGLVSRTKILACLNITEQRLPQDGRIRFTIKGREVDFRVSTSPTQHGESLVLRILDRRDVQLDFSKLGFDPAACERLSRLVTLPNGLILVAGPTGCGKSTTLFAALTLLNRPELKVFTLEDPIEYHLKGVNQVLMRPQIGLDFATAFRSILRQDPDVVMVGEIRDPETAAIAVQASLTGHLVLSTLHTNSAIAAITRLRNFGLDNFLVASSVRAIIAQRLVRTLCQNCRGKVAVGCPSCHGAGYAGRTVIYEILEITDECRQLIAQNSPELDIAKHASDNGFQTLQDCGLMKANQDETSLEEVHRHIGSQG